MGIFDFMFRANEAPASPGPAKEKFFKGASSAVLSHQAPPRRATAQLLRSYGGVPRFRAPIKKIAQSVAAVPWKAARLPRSMTQREREDRLRMLRAACSTGGLHARTAAVKSLFDRNELEEIPGGHLVLDLLNAPVKDPETEQIYLTGSDVRFVMQGLLDVVGNVYLVLMRNERGLPVQLWPMPPHWLDKGPTRDRPTYTFDNGCGRRMTYPAQDVIHMKDVDLVDPYGAGLGTGASLATELDIGEYSAQTLASHFFNGAMPEAIVSFLGMDAAAVKAQKSNWLAQHRGIGKSAIPQFTNADVKINQLSPTVIDMGVNEIRNEVADTCRETFGVPPEMLGNIENSNRATIDAAELIYSRYVLEPRLGLIEEHMNMNLLPRVDPNSGVIVYFVSPVPEDRQFLKELLASAPQAFEINDVRKIGNLPLWEGEAGELVAVPSKITLRSKDDLATEDEEETDSGLDIVDEDDSDIVEENGDEEKDDVKGHTTNRILPLKSVP